MKSQRLFLLLFLVPTLVFGLDRDKCTNTHNQAAPDLKEKVVTLKLTDTTPLLSPEEFKAREKERKDLFFKSDFLLTPDLFLAENLKNTPLPRVIPLDGQKGKKEGNFILYKEQFYRFLVQSESAVPELFIKVHENGQVIHVEKISLPFENTRGWEAYLKNGMLFIPETKLKSDFGLDLRLSFACDPTNKFSMVVAQKSTDTRYQFSISLTLETSLEEGKTTVTDAEGGITTYKIYDKQIYKITDPLGFTTLQAWFIDKESWFDPETEQVVEWNQKGGAIRSLKSTTDKRGLTTSYLYDSQGNPELITLKGEDLTGNGESDLKKKFVYNERNLCIEEEVYGQRTLTTYDPLFPYLPKRIEKYRENTLISYLDFDYNSLGQLEKEDRSGAITLWHYNDRGFPREKIQVTGTEDPDVVTTYAYNHQGQCVKIVAVDGTCKNDYDLTGNRTESKLLSPSGELLSATYIGYDLNNAPIWKHTANSENIVYFDYHASGLVKARRQSLTPSRSIAYTLYEYNPRGHLIEETDSRGYVTYRSYDPVGRIKDETKEGHTTRFSYEAGGLIETITSPSGGQVTRHYTTNGLLKEEIYPDGTKNATIYDFFGRPILETKNDIAWEIKYDDAHNRIVRTHLTTKSSEISEFDLRGNLINFTDVAGYTSEKTYDDLNRLKSALSPSGQYTRWNYRDNVVVCTLPSGEITTTHYAAGKAIKSEVSDSRGTPIAVSQFHFDPQSDKEEVIEGEERTITWRNALGLPIKIEKGKVTASYEYDSCGNCITSIDGDGRVTHQKFDGLGRLEKRELPDGSTIEFAYDPDSNLSEYHLPNGNVWKASYDSMRRKKSEELISVRGSAERWSFSYENGYLKEATDPMHRTHTYLYDSHGRIFQDSVESGKRTYTYEPRGQLKTLDQTTDIASSCVERSYNADGNLALESIYLNSQLIQETKQRWTANSRSLQIGNHIRDFIYQNNQLVQVSTQHVGVSYSYELSGALKSKNSRLSSTTIDYNTSGLPEAILTRLPEGAFQEQLDWYPSGKIYTYTAPGREQNFSYNERGYLRSTGSERYDFDFGSQGTGIRTAAPGWYVPENSLDDFGRILASVFEKTPLLTDYNAMGEVITHGQKQLSWDPWGRLVKITDPSSLWEASYDALGRRLQTRYTKSGEQTLITNSLYDPEEEFQEIGVQTGEKTFWKIYGPDACDAISDETGASITLMHNALRQLTGVISQQGTLYSKTMPSAYGPLEATPSIPSDLISYAQSLSWQSKAQDPTGFIWMGDRYYDPRSGQFLSQDPISYPVCMDLYAYADGDPVNYFDPDGRYSSYAYQKVATTTIDIVSSPRFIGSLQIGLGLSQALDGMAYTAATAGVGGFAGGGLLLLRGLDDVYTGARQVISNQWIDSGKSQLLQTCGVPRNVAEGIDTILSLGSPKGAARAGSSLLGGLLGKTEEAALRYTKSNLRLGQKIHQSYISGEVLLRERAKEYILPSKKRIDFLDIVNGKVYELKPNNPRAIREGQKQLQRYIEELKTIPEFIGIKWEGILETY